MEELAPILAEPAQAQIEDLAKPIDSLRDFEKSWVVKIACPNCGELCWGNLPPEPIGEERDSRSDAACYRCKQPLTIIRFCGKEAPQVVPGDTGGSLKSTSKSMAGSKDVLLVILGDNWPKDVDIKHIADRLNRIQNTFHFRLFDQIPGIGAPDGPARSYSPDRLSNFLRNSGECCYVVGVTNVKTGIPPFVVRMDGDAPTKIILSLRNSITWHTKQVLEDGVLSSLAASILYASYLESLQSRIASGMLDKKVMDEILAEPGEHSSDLFHREPRGCIFDFPDDEYAVQSLFVTYKLCRPCIGKAEDASVPRSTLEAGERILKVVRTPTLRKSFSSIFDSPLLSFVFGGLLIGLLINVISDILTGMRVYVMSALVALIVVFVLAKLTYDLKKSGDK